MTPPEKRRSDYDPYHDNKKYHLAKLWSTKGDVSPLCAKTPRKIDLRKESWTLRPEAVTCKRCLAAIAEKNALADQGAEG